MIDEKHCDKLVAEAKSIVQEVAAGAVPIPKVRPAAPKDDEFVRALRFLNTPGVE